MRFIYYIFYKNKILRLILIFGMGMCLFQSSCADMNLDRSTSHKGKDVPEDPSVKRQDGSTPEDINIPDVHYELISEDIQFGQVANIIFNVPMSATGTVDFSVTGKGNYVGQVVSEGKASISISDLEPGSYPVVVSYSGDGKYPSQVLEGNFKVLKDPVITMEVISTPANGYAYDVGEVIRYRIELSYYRRSEINFTVSDPFTLGNWEVGSSLGGSFVYETTHTVTEDDITAGQVSNISHATGTPSDPEEDEIEIHTEMIISPTISRTASISVTLTASPNTNVRAWMDNVTYTARILNNGNVTINNIIARCNEGTTAMHCHDGIQDDPYSYAISSLAPGEYDERQFGNWGGFIGDFGILRVNGTAAQGDNPSEVVAIAEMGWNLNPEVYVSLYEHNENVPFQLGDSVTWVIGTQNDYNHNETISFSTTDGVNLAQSVFIDVPVGTFKETTANYTVTENDIINGSVNHAFVWAVVNAGQTKAALSAPVEEPYPALDVQVQTTSTPHNSEDYVKGEEIFYRITVENVGNLTIYDVVVTDELIGDEWHIEKLVPGESRDYDPSYRVTELDILNGFVLNRVEANGTNHSDVETYPGEEEDLEVTESPRGHITVTLTPSAPANGNYYVLGERINYVVTITNNGNLTITDLEIDDELTGDEWNIDKLEPGQSEIRETYWDVLEDDVLSGQVVNTVTAQGTSPDDDYPDVPVTPGEHIATVGE